MVLVIWLFYLRHIDDLYRPDAAMTSDAGWMDGARRWVARAGFPDVSTAVDLFPTLSAFLLHYTVLGNEVDTPSNLGAR